MIVGEDFVGLGDGFYFGSDGLHDLGNNVNLLTIVHRLHHGGNLDKLLLSKGHGAEVATIGLK